MALINSSKSLPKPTNKASFSDIFRSLFNSLYKSLFKKDSFKEVYGFDLFYQLTYMSAIAASGISRSRIFQMGSELRRDPSAYFGRVHLLAQKLGYDYAKACTMVGLGLKSEVMMSLLLRLSTALGSGQPEKDFLNEESHVQGKGYEKEYETDLASLTKWTDAYAAVTVSATLIVIINMTSSLIYPLGNGVFLGLLVTAAATSGSTAWILSRAAPKEVIDLFNENGPWTQRAASKLSVYTLPALMLICSALILLHVPVGWITIASALCLFPLGIVGMMAGREIDRKNREFGPFLRSLGGMAVSTGATITEALRRIDISSYPALESDLERLRSRLAAAIDPELCWSKFALETGSKLIGETVKLFTDSIKLGADPDVIAFISADFSARTIMLRARRKVTASTFTWLTIAMHAAVSLLLVLIFEIVHNFVEMLGEASELLGMGGENASLVAMALPSFNAPQVEFFRWMTITIILILAVINAFAIGATDGGHKSKVGFYLALMLFSSGVTMLIGEPLIESFLV